jgi:hypothetical protein
MSRGMRALLVLFGCAVLAVVMLVLVGWWWWTQNGESFSKETMGGMQQGIAFGKGADNDACLQEGYARLRRDPDAEGMGHLMFMTGCLQISRPSRNFCSDAPSRWNQFAASRWTAARCAAEQLETPICTGMLSAVVNFCAEQDAEPAAQDKN